jgi:RNA polymerase sigma factor (TIGR02999 family)
MGNHHSAATIDMTASLPLDAVAALSFDPTTTSTTTATTQTPDDDVTGMVRALRTGEPAAADRLLTVLYDELRRLARGHLRRERPDHTLNATSLVHEAYLRLVRHRHQNWQSRAHFFGAASTAMRRVLVDHARGRLALKRHGDLRVSLTGCEPVDKSASVLDEVIAIDAALDRLAAIDERLVRIVDCRYFAGLTIEETAEAIGVSHTTVSDGWRFARAWLERALRAEAPDAVAAHEANGAGHRAPGAARRNNGSASERELPRESPRQSPRDSNRESTRGWRKWGSAA